MPAASFVTDADVKTLIASKLKLAFETALPPHWDSLITFATQRALHEIYDRLIARGFSLAQIAAFDRGPEFQRDLAAYFAITDAAALEQYDTHTIERLDRRPDLATVTLTCNFIAQDPGGPVQTQEEFFAPIAAGTQTSPFDLFVLDPEDERGGTPTRW